MSEIKKNGGVKEGEGKGKKQMKRSSDKKSLNHTPITQVKSHCDSLSSPSILDSFMDGPYKIEATQLRFQQWLRYPSLNSNSKAKRDKEVQMFQ